MYIQDQLRSLTYNKNPEGLTRRHAHLGKCDCKSASSTFYSFSKKHTNAMAYQLVQKVGNGSRNVDSVLLVSVIAVFEEYEQ